MHVPPSARARAFRKLVSVMSPGGSMMLTLRQGPPPAERPMEPATAADVEVLARRHGLQTVRSERVPDVFGRDGIAWEVIWLRLPDDRHRRPSAAPARGAQRPQVVNLFRPRGRRRLWSLAR